MKRKNLKALNYLTTSQALAYLHEVADSHMTEQDLYSHCLQGNLSVYIKSGENGIEGTAPAHCPGKIYGASYQQVGNPRGLFSNQGPFSAMLVGDVLPIPDADADRLESVEWRAEIDPSQYQALFNTKDVERLADEIIEASSRGPSEKAILMAVGALLDLLIKSNPTRYNQDSINKEIVDTHKEKRGLGKRNLEEIFARANEALHPEER